jgi:hypothetical protein
MENRQCTKKFGNYVFSSRFDGGNACDFKPIDSTNQIEVYPAADAQGFICSFRLLAALSLCSMPFPFQVHLHALVIGYGGCFRFGAFVDLMNICFSPSKMRMPCRK